MTGLEKMVSEILEVADASAAVMSSDAEKKAAEILGEAGEKADYDCRTFIFGKDNVFSSFVYSACSQRNEATSNSDG